MSQPKQRKKKRYHYLDDDLILPLLSKAQKKARDKIYLKDIKNAPFIGYDKTPDEIKSVIYDSTLKLSPTERVIYQKIYAYVKPKLTPLELRDVISYGRLYRFDEIGPHKQEVLLVRAVKEMQKHPYLKRLFLHDITEDFRELPICVFIGPRVDSYLKKENCDGFQQINNILLSRKMDIAIFMHETLHVYQERIGIVQTDSSNATSFLEALACEAQAEAITHLIDDKFAGLGDFIYTENLKRYETKEEAERQTVGTIMALYLSKEIERVQVLENNQIPKNPELFNPATKCINTWQKYYASNLWDELPHNQRDEHYNINRIETINHYYNWHYHTNQIAMEKAIGLVALANYIQFVRTGIKLQGKTYSSVVEGVMQETLLHIAIEEGNLSHIDHKMITDCVNLKNMVGETPLFVALENDVSEKLIEQLLKYGANVHVPNAENEYPLCVAYECCDLSIVELLLKNGANPNDLNLKEKKTVLHYAVEDDEKEFVSLLLHYHANPNIPDEKGLTPIDYAQKEEICSLLTKYAAKPETMAQRKIMSHSTAPCLSFDCQKQNG